MSLEISGKIVQFLEGASGQGANGQWTKKEFVIETADQYPKKICFSAWNDKAAQLDRFAVGNDVKVSFDVQSREYNQRWYTDLRIWKIEALNGSSPQPQPAQQNYQASAPTPASAESVNQAFANDDQDDLPF